MKFGKRLQEEMIEQWKDHYVNYKTLKQFIKRTTLTGTEFSTELFVLISTELQKSESLFCELLEGLQVVHAELLAQEPDLPLASPVRHPKFFRKQISTQPSSTSVTVNASPTHGEDHESEIHVANTDSTCFSWIKDFFFFSIGDSQLKSIDNSGPRAKFIEWYSNAHKLQYFAELNIEAIRKSAKKLKKYRPSEGDFSVSIEAKLNHSLLVTLTPRLHSMMADIETDFEKKYEDTLDRYGHVTLSQAWHAKWRYIFLSISLFCLAMYLPILSAYPSAHNCVALFTLVVSLWITEAIPFFCTAMLIPIVAVPLGIIMDPVTHQVATPRVASSVILGKVMDHVQILVLGGLTIGKALGRTHLEIVAASALHKFTAHRPPLYLLGVMLSSCFLCAFVSNVAAPLLVLGVIQRTLWEFPEGTNAPHGILLGLAFACNLGGMLSPISSPQNAVAMSVLSFHNVSFASWVLVSLPITLVTLFAAWFIILTVWKPFKDIQFIPLQVVGSKAEKGEASKASRIVVVFVSLLTITLWILPQTLFGDTGIVALIPIVIFFGIGILSKDDFNTLSWHLMFLLAGGNMLGLCARDSKMLDILATEMRNSLSNQNQYLTVFVVISIIGLVTTFVSHTVAAMILLPIVVKIGFLIPSSDGLFSVTPASLVMLSALMCSGAMAFPISSFPNVNSLLAEDETGKPYLNAKDFLFCGSAVTLVFFFCLITWMMPLATYILG